MKGCIIIGNQDPFFKNTLKLMELFKTKRIDSKLIVIEGLGHFFPQNFSQLLSEAVEYIVQ